MFKVWKAVPLFVLSAGAALLANAQANKPGPDTIVFNNGDKLVGQFVKSSDSSVTFKSDALGDLTIAWSKVKELETSAKVAVIGKGVKLRRNAIPRDVPQGTLAMQDQKLQVTPAAGAPAQSIPVANAAVVLDQAAFQKAINRTPGIFSDWNGALTAGATLVAATQSNRTFTGAVGLVRAEPAEEWLNPSYRTSFDFSASYGKLTQPGTPTIKTSIYHAAAEQDEYFTDSVFAFGQADFDHNYSQGLDLQQVYNGGIGWTIVKTAVHQLDLKASMSYVRQQFLVAAGQTQAPSNNLIGSVFAERYHRKLPHSVVLEQDLSVTPAWNNTSDYSAAFNTQLTLPVYKHLSGSTGIIDTFLNNPPVGFRKNSFQFTLGLTYTLQ